MITRAALLVVVCLVSLGAGAQSFEERFTGATLRVDYYHCGTATQERIALDRARVEGPWPGSHTQLLDTTNLGKYLVEVADAATNTVLYSRGFCSLYGEWETTGEAIAETQRCFAEAVRVPEPRTPVQVRLRKRGNNQAFHEIWSTTIDPGSRFVDRPPQAPHPVTALVHNGDPAVKADLLVPGDGYTSEQLLKYHDDARRLTRALLAHQPFLAHRDDFNVWLVDTPAERSGISHPRIGVFRETPLGARYNSFDSRRYVLTLEDRKWRDAAAAAPYDFVLILVNERTYGGGGIHNLYATAAADSAYAEYVVVHELGHHIGGLADEYFTSDVSYEAQDLVEPWEPNVTALLDPDRLKWRALVAPDTPLPTPWDQTTYQARSLEFAAKRRALRAGNADEDALEQLFAAEQELMTDMLGAERYAGSVGAFEGAMYSASGLYRPRVDCIMFTRDEVGFCPVCRQALERVISLYVR